MPSGGEAQAYGVWVGASGPAAVGALDPELRYAEKEVDDALAGKEADLALYREAQARSILLY